MKRIDRIKEHDWKRRALPQRSPASTGGEEVETYGPLTSGFGLGLRIRMLKELALNVLHRFVQGLAELLKIFLVEEDLVRLLSVMVM